MALLKQAGNPAIQMTTGMTQLELSESSDAAKIDQADIRNIYIYSYSFDAMLYYLLSGQPPFSNGGVAERFKDHVETVPVPVKQLREKVPQGLADVVSPMLVKGAGWTRGRRKLKPEAG